MTYTLTLDEWLIEFAGKHVMVLDSYDGQIVCFTCREVFPCTTVQKEKERNV